jgi:hypothetical protein
MGIPQCLPASWRAELDPLDAVALGDRLSTAETGGQTIRRALGVGAFAGQAVPLAVTLYGAYGNAEHTRDGNVAVILLSELSDHSFLLIGHGISSSLKAWPSLSTGDWKSI